MNELVNTHVNFGRSSQETECAKKKKVRKTKEKMMIGNKKQTTAKPTTRFNGSHLKVD